MGDDFKFMKQQRQKHRSRVEPDRMGYAAKQLRDAGYDVKHHDSQQLMVDGFVTFWPFTGWYSGKGVGSGRGIDNLIERLKEYGK